MQFEDFDKKIREAADHHHPSYNETAWDKMEKLLDKHLPEKRDGRRRFIFFILFPLLLAGGIWLLVSEPWYEKQKVVANKPTSGNEVQRTTAEPKAAPNTSPGQITTGNDLLSNQIVSKEDPSNNVSPGVAPPVDEQTEDFEAIVSNPTTKKKTNKRNENIANDVATNDKVTNEKKVTIPPAAPVVANNDKAEDKVPPAKKAGEKGVVVTEQKEADQVKIEAETKVNETNAKNKDKKGAKKSNSFFLSLSAGPDVSAVGSSGLGEVKLLYGAGIGYTIKDRFTIRTGFYTARKIYSAGKEDYKPNPTPPNYYYLDEVYADCKVYEIPLNFAYNFGRTSRSNFFASAGLSSYIMKEEVYDYHYKYPGNPPVTYTHTYTYKNENNHLFSVLGISGGYQRNLSKSVSVSAEPYLRIPLSGVGNGNVKLNSAGVLFSLNVKPFNR